MYKFLLIRRYLGRKLAPMFAALAVTLCTAMVIIVISVMGGFLNMMEGAARRLTGDVTIMAGWSGFPYYEQLIEELLAQPEVQVATPIIRAAGMVKFGDQQVALLPEVLGIDPEGLDAVTFYSGALYWNQQHLAQAHRGGPASTRTVPDPQQMGMAFEPDPSWVTDNPDLRGIVPGIEVYPYNMRDEDGHYQFREGLLYDGDGIDRRRLVLTVFPVTRGGAVSDPVVRQMVVVNEFKSGLYEVDHNRVYVPFDLLQQMMRMNRAAEVDPETGQPTGRAILARASEVVVRAKPEVTLDEVTQAAVRACDAMEARYGFRLRPRTWRDLHRSLLDAVQNEKGMITFLFVFISLVAVVMVATTFSMIVFEKTRDIGVLRAIGASRLGIANIFLGYGLAIGMVGAVTGLVLAVTIVYNLNEIQDVLDALFGWRMWNPQTYYFDQIPERVDAFEAGWIAVGAVISSVVGALIPAFLAARLDPVESLRYE